MVEATTKSVLSVAVACAGPNVGTCAATEVQYHTNKSLHLKSLTPITPPAKAQPPPRGLRQQVQPPPSRRPRPLAQGLARGLRQLQSARGRRGALARIGRSRQLHPKALGSVLSRSPRSSTSSSWPSTTIAHSFSKTTHTQTYPHI
jgi:hypothetical protein